MIVPNRAITFFASFIRGSEQGVFSQHPSTQLVYKVALTVFRAGLFALLTCLSPAGSLILSLGCYTANQYYRLVKEQKVKKQLQGTLTPQILQELRRSTEIMCYVNRLQHEFELVNLITLVASKHLNVPLFIICSGLSIWTWIQDRRTEDLFLQSLISAQQDIHSQELGN